MSQTQLLFVYLTLPSNLLSNTTSWRREARGKDWNTLKAVNWTGPYVGLQPTMEEGGAATGKQAWPWRPPTWPRAWVSLPRRMPARGQAPAARLCAAVAVKPQGVSGMGSAAAEEARAGSGQSLMLPIPQGRWALTTLHHGPTNFCWKIASPSLRPNPFGAAMNMSMVCGWVWFQGDGAAVAIGGRNRFDPMAAGYHDLSRERQAKPPSHFSLHALLAYLVVKVESNHSKQELLQCWEEDMKIFSHCLSHAFNGGS